MSASNIIGNRNSTPETSTSNLRPPSSRAPMPGGHQLRASADMGAFSAASNSSRNANRPASEVIYNQMQRNQQRSSQEDALDQDTQKWIADIDQYETTLDEMAAATLDQDFKDELRAIEDWFRVLTEAERTAALYSLLQQTTQVQIKFFIGVLQQMSQKHPMSGVLSPASFGEKDAMSNRLSSAMSNKFGADGNRNSLGLNRPVQTPGAKRNSGLDPDEINSMFPDAAAAIAKQKEAFTQQTGAAPTSNRSSAAIGDRSSIGMPVIAPPRDEGKKDATAPPVPPSPWRQRSTDLTSNRPKSSSGQQLMGHFSQPAPPPPSAGLRSPRKLPIAGDSNIQNTTLNAPDNNLPGLPMFSPYAPGASWASMTNTPMVSNFSQHQQGSNPADMVASATAMKLAALETVNNRVQLDDARKYRTDRRARSTEGDKFGASQGMATGLAGAGPMRNELGQILTPQQAAALQAQQLAAMGGGRSRPTSPARAFAPGIGPPGMSVAPQANGYLSVYDANPGMLSTNMGMAGLNLGGQYGVPGGEGYGSDASEINRGRSPRGRRGTSKPPEDPTDIELLKDIPAWLRSLRLHKYTDNLKDMDWQELVQLDDAGLEKRGVNALGARRKMLKVFDQVRDAQVQGKI